jgi:ABC-type multidrug transport system ATPase subunit
VDREPLVQVAKITKRFGTSLPPAIDRLDAQVEPAQVTGLVGPDGAGKTTLMRLMAGLLLPDQGNLTVCGLDTERDASKIRRCVGYMPQRFGLYEDLTVLENLNLYADLRGVAGEERRSAFSRLLVFTDLSRFTDRLARKLSGGMKQKLGLACALIRPPRLLLLDEPSVGVDPISRRELWRMVYDLVEQGIGVLWSTAYLDEAERCASVILLNQGQALYDGPPGALTARLEGRSFLIESEARGRRKLLAHAVRRPDVVDGVIEGRRVRLVYRSGVRPVAAALGVESAAITPAPARFEDAFIDLLGGVPKAESPLGAGPDARLAGTEAVVEAHELTKRFGTFTAADRISFRIGRGEIFGLLGPNGAGKSTTFKMMCGLLRPTSGLARVSGFDLVRSAGTARAHLGYMAQKFSVYGDLSVRQNLHFFAGVYGLAPAHRRQQVARMTDAFGLAPYLDQTAGLLPLGFKQRLALACAVMHEPAVLFLDEPTSGVDPLTRREFWAHINAMVERGVTVMVTTHFLDEAEYCDRIGLIYHGRLIAHDSPDELKSRARTAEWPEPTLEDAFIALIEGYDQMGGSP